MPGPLYVLGPQRPEPNLPEALASIGGSGRVVLITAGWRHEEADVDSLERAVGSDAVLLPLYDWFEDLLRRSPDRIGAHHGEQQNEIRSLKEIYRMRLGPALRTVHDLMEVKDELVAPELEDARNAVRRLDRRFITRCDEIRARFLARWNPLEDPRVRDRHAAVADVVHGARAVLIAGGHVGVLRNRLAFFGMGEVLRAARGEGTAIVAWSAGAMALTERVVLFHDDPPIGLSDPEVLDRGFGLVPNAVLLPHARDRLALEETWRVALLASRFAPARCVGLENGAWLTSSAGGAMRSLGVPGAALLLGTDGAVTEVTRAARP